MNDHRLSDNFFDYEFKCKCGCGRIWVSETLVQSLEDFRSLLGRPVYLLSGCRCHDHNICVGGSKHSQHRIDEEDGTLRKCRAGDVYAANTRPRQMFRAAMKVPAFLDGGIGIYEKQGFIHLDVRGVKARWFFMEKGAKPTGIPRNYY